MRVDLFSGATTRARLLVVVSAAALVVAVAYGAVALVVVAAATMTPLLFAATRARTSPSLVVTCTVPTGTIIEGEGFDLTLTLTFDDRCEGVLANLDPNDWLTVRNEAFAATDTSVVSWTTTLTATRWGPVLAPTVVVCAVTNRGLVQSQGAFHLPVELVALPRPAPMGPLATAHARRGRVGNHPSLDAGSGVEFQGIRPYEPGDLPRRVHWPTSTRRGQLYVTERAAETAIDTVVVIDAFTESGAAGGSTLDHSVRGAAGVAKAMLESGDRVGLAMLGGMLGWLAPATSRRQWYRIATTALGVSVQESFVTPDIARIPSVAMPAGAFILVFSPLLDDRVMTVLSDLRRRRFVVLVIDVLPGPEVPRRATVEETLAHRLWRLDRAGLHARLTTIGCTVMRWDGYGPVVLPRRGWTVR